jgi:hypothetical protein
MSLDSALFLLESFRDVARENEDKQYDLFAVKFFRHIFDGRDYKGNKFTDQMQVNHVISLAKSLHHFRIRD